MKIIRVYSCAYCPHLVYFGPRECCGAMLGNSRVEDNKIAMHVSLGTTPDWCPLEDAPEKEKGQE